MLSPDSRVGRSVLGFAEFLPLLAFVYAGRFEADYPERFVWGAGTALVVVPALLLLHRRLNPLLVAVAIWLCFEAFAILLPITLLGEALGVLQEAGFFLAILAVGAGYVLAGRGLFAVVDGARARRASFVLLALAGGGLVWALVFRGNEAVAAVLPATVLFVAQMMLAARLRDRADAS